MNANIKVAVLTALLTTCVSSLAATIRVTATADSGPGSLRQAIAEANASVDVVDTIEFHISGSGPHTIQPQSPLPAITDPVVIDGYTQPESTPNTLTEGDDAVLMIVLDGSQAGADAYGLRLESRQSEVRGLVVNGFAGGGIRVSVGGGNVVAGNFVGTDVTGTIAIPNGYGWSDGAGVGIFGSDDNWIGGTASAARNVVSGNPVGVHIHSGSRNQVQGNFIGTDAAGTSPLPNTGQAGVLVYGPGGVAYATQDNLIGGSAPGAGNLISGNLDSGIDIYSSGNLVKGNLIGTDVTGTKALGNGADGIRINVWITTGGNTVGGTEEGARNIISGNGNYGIEFQNIETGGVIQGNYIGTDVTGTQSIPGQMYGIIVQGGGGHSFGGTTPEARNVIVASGVGIIVYSPNNVIQGNYVGVDATGATTFSLGGGPEMSRGFYVATLWAHDNEIGGTEPGAGNVVSGCETGIFAEGCNRNRFQSNIVGADASGGIALGNALGIVVQKTAEAGSENLVEGNVVVASRQVGIALNGVSATRVEGNVVGTDRTQTLNLGNQIGICLDACTGTKLGGTEAGAANTIAFSRLDGIVIVDDLLNPITVQANSIRANSIRQSGGLGINLVPFVEGWILEPPPWSDWQAPVVTPNDLGDADLGPNGLQNYPVITSASALIGKTKIEGTLNSTALTSFTLDFYANTAGDPSGYGEGETYLGAATVMTDASGHASISVIVPTATTSGQIITATATDPDGNTSEFSGQSPPVVLGVIEVAVDIKPGSNPNSIHLASKGTVPVAILGSASFSAASVNPTTVTLAGATVKLTGKGKPMASLEDVNRDGYPDLVVHVLTSALQLNISDTTATLNGQTYDSLSIAGTDSVRVVPK